MRDLLDAGAARVQKELAGEPELLAEMLTVIGRVYQRLEITDKAQPLLEQALALGRGVGGPEHPRVGADAQRSRRPDAHERRRRRVGGDAGGIARDAAPAPRREAQGRRRHARRSSADRTDRLGQRERAEALAREALAMRREMLGEDHRETATSMGDLGLLLWQRGDLAGAEPLLRQSLADQPQGAWRSARQCRARRCPIWAWSSPTGATTPPRRRSFARPSPSRRKALGPTHAGLAVTLNNLAYPLREQGKYPEAVAALEEALALAMPAKGEDSPTVANYRTNLARVHLAKGDAAAAEPLLRQSLAARLRAFGKTTGVSA